MTPRTSMLAMKTSKWAFFGLRGQGFARNKQRSACLGETVPIPAKLRTVLRLDTVQLSLLARRRSTSSCSCNTSTTSPMPSDSAFCSSRPCATCAQNAASCPFRPHANVALRCPGPDPTRCTKPGARLSLLPLPSPSALAPAPIPAASSPPHPNTSDSRLPVADPTRSPRSHLPPQNEVESPPKCSAHPNPQSFSGETSRLVRDPGQQPNAMQCFQSHHVQR
jgi:hypothetical protein